MPDKTPAGSLVELLQEQYEGKVAAAAPAVTAVAKKPTTALARTPEPYTPQALVQFILANPGWTHQQYGEAFGCGSAWFAGVLASQSFQTALDPVRGQIHDPSITATMDERFRALTMQGLSVLQSKLDGKEVSDFLVVKAVELGTKALGMGQAVPVTVEAPKEVGAEAVAARIMQAMADAKARTNATAVDAVIVKETPNGA